MAAGSSTMTEGNKNLHDIFLNAWKNFDELEESTLDCNSKDFQEKVQKCMEKFEAATRVVSELDMFSSNELVEELSTESLQYLLLPLFLGKLAVKLNRPDRMEVLDVAEIYFEDFLKRCLEYQLGDGAPKECVESKKGDGNPSELAQLMREAHSRNAKIEQYRRRKDLEVHIKSLKNIVNSKDVDEEIKREYFLKHLKKGIIDAGEEVESLRLEKQMVEMSKMHLSSAEIPVLGAAACGGDCNDKTQTQLEKRVLGHSHVHGHNMYPQPKPKPLQPFIITRNATQKAVFGLGYPSLPVLSVDEFYKQRVQDGIFPDAVKVKQMNQQLEIAASRNENEKEDEEQAILEEQIENDDHDNLARMRRMDDYKDVVRRGDGNRHNRS